MRVCCGLLLVLWAGPVTAQNSLPPAPAPFYASSSIVNAASAKVEGLAPNTLASLYGVNLAYTTRALVQDDISGVALPTGLAGTGVKVLVAKMPVPLLYVSPTQVNFVVPPGLPPGPVEIQLGLDSRFGPAVHVPLHEAAPALFHLDPEYAIAARVSGAVITRESPARGGEIVSLYATGLGATNPRAPLNQIVTRAARLARFEEFRVMLDGVALPRESVLYAGLAPGFAGLYQINIVLPEVVPRNPEIRIGFGEVMSPAGVRLPVQ